MAFQKAIPFTSEKELPKTEGGRGFTDTFDFTSVSQINRDYSLPDSGLSAIKSVFVDNSLSNQATTLNIAGITQSITFPPYSQGYLPILQSGQTLQVRAQSTGTAKVNITYLNVHKDLMIWSTLSPGSVTGTVAVSGSVTTLPFTSTYTDRSSQVFTGGTSQTLAIANGSRKRLFIFNPFTLAGQNIATLESIYVNFTSAAQVDGTTSIEIPPGGSFDTGQGPCTTELVTVTSTTTGHRYVAKEM